MSDQQRCTCCQRLNETRHYALHVDGEALSTQADLCQDCADNFVFRVGEALGRLMRERRAWGDKAAAGRV